MTMRCGSDDVVGDDNDTSAVLCASFVHPSGRRRSVSDIGGLATT